MKSIIGNNNDNAQIEANMKVVHSILNAEETVTGRSITPPPGKRQLAMVA